jgi:hypothetical protein
MKRETAQVMNYLLQSAYESAQAGDNYEAQRVHEYLNLMLTEQVDVQGKQWWLTEFGKQVSAEIHDRLSQCEGRGNALLQSILDASLYTKHRGLKRNSGSVATDHMIAHLVAEAVYQQHVKGEKQNLTAAAQTVADSGKFKNQFKGENLTAKTILQRYYASNKWEQRITGESIIDATIATMSKLSE